jgi:sugar lactone lactonase YvrE
VRGITLVRFAIGATENKEPAGGTLILSDIPGQPYHVLTGSFASRSSPGGLGVVNFPDNHFIGHTIDEDHVILNLDGEIPVHFATSASSSLCHALALPESS